MKQSIRITLIILGIALILVPTSTFAFLSEEVIVGEQLCVDGNHNVNLEGLMCEETKLILPGILSGIGEWIMFITIPLGGFLFILGLSSEPNDKKVELI